jgi:outer membrane protein assembly factor BamB
VVWQSADLSDYARYDLVGPPLLVGERLFITAKSNGNPQMPQQGQPQQVVLAIQPHDGKILWSTEVGTFRQGQQMYYYYGFREPSAQPQLTFRAGALYVDTHVGVLARLDADTGALDWGYGYPTAASMGMGRFFFYPPPPTDPTTASSPPTPVGDALLVKGVQSGRLFAVDPNRMKVLWDRVIAKSSRLLGADDRSLFLGGPELSALDLATRKLLWATRLPGGSMEARVLVRPDGLWQLTSRGVFELDPKSGEVRRIFRGQDLGAVGGDLILTDRMLLTVSNRSISAYPRRPDEAAVSRHKDPASSKKAEDVE